MGWLGLGGCLIRKTNLGAPPAWPRDPAPRQAGPSPTKTAPQHPIGAPPPKVETLLSEVVPSLTLGELSALRVILSRLAAPPTPRLAVGRLVGPLMNLLVAEFTRGHDPPPPADAAAARDQSAGDEDARGAAGEGQRRARLAFELLR